MKSKSKRKDCVLLAIPRKFTTVNFCNKFQIKNAAKGNGACCPFASDIELNERNYCRQIS